jgi:hypothetical protein
MFLQRLPFTLGFIGSMAGTLYVSMVWHSYVLSVLFSVIQVASTTQFHSLSLICLCLAMRVWLEILILLQLLHITIEYMLICGCFSWCPREWLKTWSNFILEKEVHEFAGMHWSNMIWNEKDYPVWYWNVVFIDYAGSCPCILCDFLLPWWICWAKIPLIFPCLIGDETFREVTFSWRAHFSLYIFSFCLSSRFS